MHTQSSPTPAVRALEGAPVRGNELRELLERAFSHENLHNEIVLNPKGNTYSGSLAQLFATGRLKLPTVFCLDSSTELFRVFQVTDTGKVIERAAVSSRARAQSYMAPDRVCVYRYNKFTRTHLHEGLGVECTVCGSPHYPMGATMSFNEERGWWECAGQEVQP